MTLSSLALALTVMGFLCLRCHRSNDTASNNIMHGGVGKLIKNGFKNGAKKSGGAGMGAAYRKLSDDTERLVTSSKPFYDFPSSDEGEAEIL